MDSMLECTWSDTEAEVALRRMLIKEQKQQLLAKDAKREEETRIGFPRTPDKRTAANAGYHDNF